MAIPDPNLRVASNLSPVASRVPIYHLTMPRFQRTGIQFDYPSTWVVDDDGSLDGWTVTLQSPGSSFVVLALRSLDETATEVTDEALAAMKSEHKDLESEPVIDQFGGQPVTGYNLDFVTVDQVATARVRGLETVAGPLLILAQIPDRERDEFEAEIDSILESIELDE